MCQGERGAPLLPALNSAEVWQVRGVLGPPAHGVTAIDCCARSITIKLQGDCPAPTDGEVRGSAEGIEVPPAHATTVHPLSAISMENFKRLNN